ncbi:FAD-binding domain-containing protein [Polyplosphaeria fusca]|uniref:FAD-binding domain-containing protein n=1 Tax=Polyplosphaeria fusca TaxID=682080 RepID=A0A9P4R339_9PLEO|nr:FAD-binding domain-containing protein [Polyplosphaeria fusca]
MLLRRLVLQTALLGAATLTHASAPYCLPGDTCFPSDHDLRQLNISVNGRLIQTKPYGSACYKATYNAGGCLAVAANNNDSDFRLRTPPAVMYTNAEQVREKDTWLGCPIPDLSIDEFAPSAIDGSCTLGNMSPYIVNASSVNDIVEAVNFAAKYNLRFRIKNTGHDYLSRSTGQGSLTIWTHYMNDVKLIKGFKTCYSDNRQDVISVGPGVTAQQLYAAGANYGVVTIGSFTATVGAAGGYVLGGGSGPLSSMLGLAIDNVVQFEVVTADGDRKIVNGCTNQDLFWALRGGGGAFAVVIRVFYKTYPAFTAINTVFAQVGCLRNESYKALIDTVVELQVPFRHAGQMGIWSANKGLRSVSILSLRPFTNDNIEDQNNILKLFDRIRVIKDCTSQVSTAQFRGDDSWNQAYNTVLFPVTKAGAPVGINIINLSRLVPYKMMENTKGSSDLNLQRIKDYIFGLPLDVSFLWQNTIGEATRKIAPNATAIHPDWREAFGYINAPVVGPWHGMTDEQIRHYKVILKKTSHVFGDAAYYNEDYFFEKNWQESFFGANYPRLLRIKKAVDPKGLFNCPLCVGAEDGW